VRVLTAITKQFTKTTWRRAGGISRLERAEAETKEANGLVLRKSVRRPPLFSVDLNLLYVMAGPPVVAGIDSLVYADEHATHEILIEPQDLLVGIDDHDVTQVKTFAQRTFEPLPLLHRGRFLSQGTLGCPVFCLIQVFSFLPGQHGRDKVSFDFHLQK
jgi:hypothetical protein